MNPTRTRGIILNKIKQALSKKKNNLQEPNFSSPVFAYKSEEDRTIVFAENFVKTKGEFIFCESESYFHNALQLLIQKRGIKNIHVWEDKLFSYLEKSQITYKRSDSELVSTEVGITTCEVLIARTGSMFISSATRSGRRLSVFPPIHIVVAYTSQIVEDIDNGLLLIKNKYNGNLPSMISLVTGPSRTADIEKTLVLGAHGPKELILFLIDDSTKN